MGRPLAFNTVEELEIAVDDYFKSDDAHIVSFVDGSEVKMFAPTMSGLALHLDVDRKTITNYSNKEDYFPTIRKARSKIEAHIEKRLYGNNVTGCIFNLKNNFGWKDKSEIDNTSSDGSMTPTKITRVVIDESTDTDS